MQLIDSDEAARRLGVKLSTLYAYVSRGLLESRRSPDSRKSLFELGDVERLASRARRGRETETRLATINTSVTQIGEGGPIYRGVPAVDLLTRSTFEGVAELLWEGTGEPWVSLELDVSSANEDRERLRLVAVLASAADSFRSDRRPESIRRAARTTIATAARSVGQADRRQGGSIAAALAGRARSGRPLEELIAAFDAALVLLADHELAVSTLAVRIAASTRADYYDAVLSGMGAGGPLHIGASLLAHDFLADAQSRGVERAIDETLQQRSRLPGFGHAVYKDRDPRLTALLPFIRRVDGGEVCDVLESVLRVAEEHDLRQANIDLGIGALTLAAGARREFGATLFTISRMAGWTAHYLEELDERPLRFRTRAVYVRRSGPTTSEGRVA